MAMTRSRHSRRACSRRGIGEIAFLEAEHAADDLQIVFHAVVDFAQQNFLFLQGLLDLFVSLTAAADVAEVYGQPFGRRVDVDLEPSLVGGVWMELFEVRGLARAHDLFVDGAQGAAGGFRKDFPEMASEKIAALARP